MRLPLQRPTGQGHVDSLPREGGLALARLERLFAFVVGGLEREFGAICRLPKLTSLVRSEAPLTPAAQP